MMRTKIQKAKMLTLQSRICDLENRSLTINSAQARTIHTYLYLVRQIVESNKNPKKKSLQTAQIRQSRNHKFEGFGKKLSIQCRYPSAIKNSKKGSKGQQFRISNAKGFRKNTISVPNKFISLHSEQSHQQLQKQANFTPIGSLYQQNLSISAYETVQQGIIFEDKSQIKDIAKDEIKNNRKKISIKPRNSFFRNWLKPDFRNSNYKNFLKESITRNSECELLSKSVLYTDNSQQRESPIPPMPW